MARRGRAPHHTTKPWLVGLALATVAGLALTQVPASTANAAGHASAGTTRAPVAARPAASSRLWHATRATLTPSRNGHTLRVAPKAFRAFTLDDRLMAGKLRAAPALRRATGAAPSYVSLPAPDGTMVKFRIYRSPVLMPKIQARHPQLQTYAGNAVRDPRVTVRLDRTPMGFHASVRSPGDGAAWYIDPAYNGSTSLYLSYLGGKVPASQKGLVEPRLSRAQRASLDRFEAKLPSSSAAPGFAGNESVARRTYRLALASDPTYANYFGSANVLAEKVTLMNRVNQIYNDDDAFRMVLVNQTASLNFDTDAKLYNPNGPCGISPCFASTGQIQGGCVAGSQFTRLRYVLGILVGSQNYDIGHIMLGINGGGVAGLGVVGTANKASGCTGLPQPQGDFMAIDYVAHEMGHEFGGNHTFNGNQYNCSSGNRNGRQGVEPGSGSSVMAYAGICLSDDLQPHTDPYFSQRSQTEFQANALAAKPNMNEIQSVALAGFDTALESYTITLTKPDTTTVTTAPIVRGATPVPTATIDTAIETALGAPGSVTVANLPGNADTDAGFQVTFGGAPFTGTAVAPMTVTVTNGDAVQQVSETIQGGPATNAGYQVEMLGNHAPTVTAPAGKTIPVQTPFELTGSATDTDPDSLLYLWEENDNGLSSNAGGVGLTNNTKATGPLFRVFGHYANVTPAGTLQIDSPGENHADANPTRTFPDMDQILANQTNAATGSCPAPKPSDYKNGQPTVVSGGVTYENTLANGPVLECLSEFLPTPAYVGVPSYPANGFSPVTPANNEPSLNFRLTVRDQNPTNGGYSFGDTKLTLDPTAGPLLVTSQNGGQVTAGTTGTVTWNVAHTDKPTLAPQVEILLSTDGGHTWPQVLVGQTPNNGSATVTWPVTAHTSQARIRVQAVGNYFFDVDDANFTINPPPSAPDTTITSGPRNGSFVRSNQVRFGYASTAPGSTFRCTLDTQSRACGGSFVTLSHLRKVSHVFSVAAVLEAVVDPTAATRSFTVPRNVAALKQVKGTPAWSRHHAVSAYLGTFKSASTQGATLRSHIKGATALAIVVGKAPSFGAVDVFLDGTLLKKVSLHAAKAKGRRIVLVKSFKGHRTGMVTIVAADNRTVRVEGLGVQTIR